jgi:hypothetical protein
MNDLDHILYEVEQQERNFADFEDLRFAEIFLTDKEAKSKKIALHVGRTRNKSKQQS